MSVLTVKRGDAERLRATEETYETFSTGLRFMVKYSLRDADDDAVIDKAVGSGITITTVGSSTVYAVAQIVIDPADTEQFPNRQVALLYELIDGAAHTLDSGTLIVQPELVLGE